MLPELQEFHAQGIDSLDHVIYSFGEVMRTNMELRENKEIKDLYLPFGHFLFIGGAGNEVVRLFGLAFGRKGQVS